MCHMETVEFLILKNLLYNEEYVRKVIPFIKGDYFEDINQKIVFEEIIKFVQEYNQPATKEILCIEAEKRQDITDDSFREITNLISNLDDKPSEFDRQHAWPGFSYIIISIHKGKVKSYRSWQLQSNRERFIEEKIIVGQDTFLKFFDFCP